jgi:hypothetical protein
MRVLFYLPLARKWMLENVLEPMIAKLAPLAEVHVMLPAVWLETGSASVASQATAWRRNVTWHTLEVADGDLHSFNMSVPAPEILAAATAIAPDHCLCRSASRSLPEHLPGQVQYIMEASAPPFRLPTHWVSLQPQIFDHGLVPDLPPEQRTALIALIASAWRELERARPRDPSWRRRHALPSDRKIVALPLEYDHPDNLFGLHRSVRPNPALVAQLADRMDTRLFLAITDHPLNVRFVDQRELIETIDARGDKARLLLPPAAGGDITSALAQHADGMIVSDSKSFAAAAFYGTPLLRTSKFASGSWLRAYTDLDTFANAMAAGNAMAADREDAMFWFAYYLAAQAFAPGDADLTGTEILERITGEIHPQRWASSFARLTRLQRGGTDNLAVTKEEEA